jgi:uncharacterized protein (TIGR00297 family)
VLSTVLGITPTVQAPPNDYCCGYKIGDIVIAPHRTADCGGVVFAFAHRFFAGDSAGTRTQNQRIKSPLLCRLSYGVNCAQLYPVGTTSRHIILGGVCSTDLERLVNSWIRMNWYVSAALAVVAALAIALLAYKKKTLTIDGALAAAAVGALIVIGAGWWGGVILLTFFVSSSALSIIRAKRKGTSTDRHSRGNRRDMVQVLANGGAAAVFAIVFGINEKPFAFAASAGAIAAANADTWATEIGGMSRQIPRLLFSRKRVEPGVSGGVTLAGFIASLAGAASIGLVAGLGIALGAVDLSKTAALVIASLTIGGLFGSIVDSVLGESVQAVYFCPTCNTETEDRVHKCGSETKRLRGIDGFNNDVVNAVATLSGALVAGLLTF